MDAKMMTPLSPGEQEQLAKVSHLALPERDMFALAALVGFCELSRTQKGRELMWHEHITMTIGKDGAMLTLVTPKWRAVFQAPAGAFRRAVACEFTRVIDGVEALRKGLWWLIEHAKPKHIREHAVAMARDAGELCGDANGLAFNSSVEIYQPLHEIKLVSMISRKELH